MQHTHTKKGFLKYLIVLAIGLALASYYLNFSVKDVVENERTQENFHYIKDKVGEAVESEEVQTWTGKAWDFFKEYIWDSFATGLGNLKNHEQTVFEKAAPALQLYEETNGENEEAKEVVDSPEDDSNE